MADMQKIGLDQIPGYAALVLISDIDIRLLKAGKRYRDFFAPEDCGRGKSLLTGLSDFDRTALCSGVRDGVKRRRDITYTRRFLRNDGEMHRIRVNAAYIEEMDGLPVYLAIAEEMDEACFMEQQLAGARDLLRAADSALASALDALRKNESDRKRFYRKSSPLWEAPKPIGGGGYLGRPECRSAPAFRRPAGDIYPHIRLF